MSEPEAFEEWKRHTAPSPESLALARSARLPVYIAAVVVIAFWSSFDYADKLTLLAVLALWYPTGVLTRRLLSAGATLDDPRLRRIRWARLALLAVAGFALAWGSVGNLVLVASLAGLATADLHWNLSQRLNTTMQAWRDR